MIYMIFCKQLAVLSVENRQRVAREFAFLAVFGQILPVDNLWIIEKTPLTFPQVWI